MREAELNNQEKQGIERQLVQKDKLAQEEKNKRKQQLRELEQSIKEIEELKIKLAQKDEKIVETSKRKIIKRLEVAIGRIKEAVKNDEEMLTQYKKQSIIFMCSGIACFSLASVYLVAQSLGWFFEWGKMANTDSVSVFKTISPGLILAVIGTGLLRYDWKIRQLALRLIEQNNQVDIATGVLIASLEISDIDIADKNINKTPELVQETFKETRRALLFKQQANAFTPSDKAEPSEIQQLANEIAKLTKQTTDKTDPK